MTDAGATAVQGVCAGVIVFCSAAAGDYALILLGGTAGVMHSIGRIDLPSKTKAAFYIIRWVFTALMLTGFAAYLIQTYTSIPAQKWPGVVAFAITFLADKWMGWIDIFGEKLFGMFAKKMP